MIMQFSTDFFLGEGGGGGGVQIKNTKTLRIFLHLITPNLVKHANQRAKGRLTYFVPFWRESCVIG